MKKEVNFFIDINDNDELLCGSCFSKRIVGSTGSGRSNYYCDLFATRLSWDSSGLVISFGEMSTTKRCDDCLLMTGTKKKYMGTVEVNGENI